jgi:hypothetical protein
MENGGFTFFAICLASFISMLLGGFIMSSQWRGEMIERGLGLYCPTDGTFAFTGECSQ